MNFNIENTIQLCKQSNRKAQADLYAYTYKKLIVAVALYTKDKTERDWVFNLGMLKVFSSIENFKLGSNFMGWARTILVRSAIDHIRSNKTYNDHMSPIEVEEDYRTLTSMNEVLNTINTEELITLVQSLANKERMIFTLYEIDGYQHNEIEELTGIKANTSKWLLAKARKALRKKASKFHNVKREGNGK